MSRLLPPDLVLSRLYRLARSGINLTKMHFLVHSIGMLLVLTTVKCSEELVGNNNMIPSGNDDKHGDGSSSRISLSIDELVINEGHPSSLELRKDKCGKTKPACEDAGGFCMAKTNEDDCDGKLLKGRKYCGKKKCGCCVPEEKPPCSPETCTLNQIEGICARDAPEGYTYIGTQECSSGCICFTPGELCRRDLGRSCFQFPYFPKYASSSTLPVQPVPCVCGLFDGQLISAECKDHFFTNENWCLSAANEIVNCTQDFCNLEPTHFAPHHVCNDCFTKEDATEWCNNNQNLRGNFNHVFGAFWTIGMFDWALAPSGVLQRVCMIPEHVRTWYCRKHNYEWECLDHQYCTGGGAIETLAPWDTLGQFIPKSFDCVWN